MQKRPVAVICTDGQRRLVQDASGHAQQYGIKPGMSAAEAHALCRSLICIDDDPTGDSRTLEALGRWLTRFTPVVSCGWDDCEDTPAALFLDLTGCERLFGGIAPLASLIEQSLQRFNFHARIAVAPTVGCAWAFAATGRGNFRIIEAPSLVDAVSSLPVETLRLNKTILSDLHHLGLLNVGDVLALPRDELPARFGSLLSKRLDQLIGTLAEPLDRLAYDPPIIARTAFDAPIEAPEMIGAILGRLFDEILSDLARRNHGVRILRILLTPDRGWGKTVVIRQIILSRPHRHRATLLDLVRCEIERIDCEHGFVRFQIDVPQHEPVAETQAQFFEEHSATDEMEFERLLQRLRSRLGDEAVIRPEHVESYLPERAWRPAMDGAAVSTAIATPPRPLTLFPTPIEILVTSEPSDDRTGHPRQFTWRGKVHLLKHIIGPERIAGEWWRGHRRTRDYYEVEDEAGLRFWIFRVLNARVPGRVSARWFLHGRFA